MKYSFTCRQPLRVGGGDGADQVLLGDHLVDHLADPVRAALGREGEPGAAAAAGQLVGQRHVERVHPGGRQRQAGLACPRTGRPGSRATSCISLWSELDSDSSPTSLNPLAASPVSTMSDDRGLAALANRPGDHAGLAEPAAPGAAAEDLHADTARARSPPPAPAACSGKASRPGPSACAWPPRPGTPRTVGPYAADPAVRQVGHVVEPRARRPRRRRPAAAAARRGRRAGRPPSSPATRSVIVSTACSPSPSTAPSRNSAIGSGLNAACPPASTTGCVLVAVRRGQRDAGQVQRGQQVRVAELGGEAHAQQVEGAHRPVRRPR